MKIVNGWCFGFSIAVLVLAICVVVRGYLGLRKDPGDDRWRMSKPEMDATDAEFERNLVIVMGGIVLFVVFGILWVAGVRDR